MVHLKILSGKLAGASWVARHFPVRIGRGPTVEFQADEDGVWDEHMTIGFSSADGFTLQACSEAVVCLNGQLVSDAVLRNGDLMELGALKLQFWLGEPRQRGLTARETLIWAGIAAVSLAQIALIYWLPK